MVMDASMAATAKGPRVLARVGACWRACWRVLAYVGLLVGVARTNLASCQLLERYLLYSCWSCICNQLGQVLNAHGGLSKVRLLVNEEVEASQQQAKNVACAFFRATLF